MDELTIEGKNYISSKRAAALTGYAKDYVGQLCREGRVEARLVGRSWYVYEPSIRKHRFEGQGVDQQVSSPENIEVSEDKSSEKANIEAVSDTPLYKAEEVSPLPLSNEEVPEISLSESASKSGDEESVEEIQEAWQQWFEASKDEAVSFEPKRERAEEPETELPSIKSSEETEEVPFHTVETPVQVHIEPMRVPRYTREEVYIAPSTHTGKRKRSKSTRNHIVVKALLVALILLSVTVTVIGSSDTSAISGNSNAEFWVVNYLEGLEIIRK